jgi:hypothetical protein
MNDLFLRVPIIFGSTAIGLLKGGIMCGTTDIGQGLMQADPGLQVAGNPETMDGAGDGDVGINAFYKLQTIIRQSLLFIIRRLFVSYHSFNIRIKGDIFLNVY